jgi:hypothetical protein
VEVVYTVPVRFSYVGVLVPMPEVFSHPQEFSSSNYTEGMELEKRSPEELVKGCFTSLSTSGISRGRSWSGMISGRTSTRS